MSNASLPKQYDPSQVEAHWRQLWRQRRYSHADENAPAVPYAITLPPPNVTGSLHMGHALGDTLQDVLIRWKRMLGFNAMWMPGIDHAGIATQMLVERDVQRRENTTRHELGREAFLERVWAWKERFGGRISEQLQVMGFSLDWERSRFTMDEESAAAVREVFVRLYEEGLIYRAQRLVNWCVDCHTAVSDLEVDNVDEAGKLWELQYPVVGQDRRITVATTRPETMLGDTGVAVHPEDPRYAELIGQYVELPLTGRQIPIVADAFVDPEFGSGAVKVTPGHDFNDFEAGQRCHLETLSIIDKQGRITAPAPAKYVGMTVAEARAAVVAELEELGLLGAVKDYTVPRGRCQRSATVIEPLLSEQWFVKAEILAKPAIEAVEQGKTKFVPELWAKTYMHWMTNIKDWCISRQLWWGHRIPAWYCDGCGAVRVARETPAACGTCGGAELRQDSDVLDTWFSSALWPFSTLGWPDDSRALKAFYPNAVLVTAPDIIFFWVARMMMMGLHFMGKVPFRTVYLTPIVTDENGDKMSKTKGNVIDPLDIVHGASAAELVARAEDSGSPPAALKQLKKSFPKGIAAAGSDALRFSLAAMTMPGRNIRLSMERVEGYRNFINKLWNASRFALMNLEGFDADRFAAMLAGSRAELGFADRWILSRLQQACADVDEALGGFRFSDAANAIYHFVWHELCDWYIELAKPSLRPTEESDSTSQTQRFASQGTLAHTLETSLRLLHPFAPFVTEEIWQRLPKAAPAPESLMITLYPRREPGLVNEDVEAQMRLLQEVVVAIRQVRATYSVPPSQRIAVEVRCAAAERRVILETHGAVIENAARVTLSLAAAGPVVPRSAKSIVGADIEVVVPLADLIDVAAEQERISKELSKTEKEIQFMGNKLANKNFVDRAPPEVVDEVRSRLSDEEHRQQRLREALETLR